MKKNKLSDRSFGVLCAISMLRGNHGIGDMGKGAYEFIDILEQMGVTRWQILPIHPLGNGNSPYMPLSSFSGELLYIDVSEYDSSFITNSSIDYDEIFKLKIKILKKAFRSFNKCKEYYNFIKENEWLEDYVCYMEYCKKGDREFHYFVQYLFFKQYNEMKMYANCKGIFIIGDLPLYVSYHCAEVFNNPSLFELDENNKMIYVSGACPDYFNEQGQVWNHPIYRYDVMEKDHFSWWKKRIDYAFYLYDFVRLDHFKGLIDYYVIKNGALDGKDGWYCKGPRYAFFDAVFDKELIERCLVEDLGDIDDTVKELKSYYGFIGMGVYVFDQSISCRDTVYYSGTHDNDVVFTFLEDHNIKYDDFLTTLFSSKSNLIIMPIQDMILNSRIPRMNTPGTTDGNWVIKLETYDGLEDNIELFKNYIQKHNR